MKTSLTKLNSRLARLIYSLRMFGWLVDPRFWWGQNFKQEIDRPIFILGMQGGGITLLTRILRRHGSVIAARGGKEWWSGPDEIQNVFGPALPPELTGLRWKVPPHPKFGKLRSWSYASNELLKTYRRTCEDVTHNTQTKLRNVIGYALKSHGRKIQTPRFVDKSQVNMVRAGLIHAALKDANPQFVMVLRNPYVSVFRAANGAARDMKDLAETTTLDERLKICAEHYANSVRAVFEDAAQCGFALKVMRIEDLFADPAKFTAEFCHHVSLVMHDDMIPAPHHRLVFGSRFADRWYPVNQKIDEKYWNKIDKITIAIVNTTCESLFERLGYEKKDESDF